MHLQRAARVWIHQGTTPDLKRIDVEVGLGDGSEVSAGTGLGAGVAVVEGVSVVGVSLESATPQAEATRAQTTTMPTTEAARNSGIHNLCLSFVTREVREIMNHSVNI